MCVPSYTPRTDGRMDMDRQLLRSNINSRFRAIERGIYHKNIRGLFPEFGVLIYIVITHSSLEFAQGSSMPIKFTVRLL